MKIFLTGATGYLGYNLAKSLVEQGHQVHALVRNPDAAKELNHPNIRIYKGDITEMESILPAMEDCDQVYHVAALARMQARDRSLFYSINTSGTGNLLEAALKLGVRKFVFTSSAAVLGPSLQYPVQEDDPRITSFDNDYELSKQLAENLVMDYTRRGLNCVIVSPTRVYGPGPATYSNAINRFVKNFICNGFAIIPAGLSALGNYVFIKDVVKGHLLAMEYGKSGEKYILGGENISFNDFFKTIKDLSGSKGKYIRLPRKLLSFFFFCKEKIDKLFRVDTDVNREMLERFYINRALSSKKACDELGYSITPFVSGMRQTIKPIQQTILCKTINIS